jgi:prepilin-type N-terminal cleavage/methylation domain-containing protein
MMNSKGITLIELLVVVTIVGILLTMGTIGYRRLSVKANVESDTRQILAVTNMARQYSFTRKVTLKVSVNEKVIKIIDTAGNDYEGLFITAKTPFETEEDITFTGGFSTVTGMIRSSAGDSGAEYDCVLYEANSVSAGKYDGENCNVR